MENNSLQLEERPRKNNQRWSYSAAEMNEKLLRTTPRQQDIAERNSKFFRRLGKNGIISYDEYLFLRIILTEPRNGLHVAFRILDTDGNQFIDNQEYKILGQMFGGVGFTETQENDENHVPFRYPKLRLSFSYFVLATTGGMVIRYRHFRFTVPFSRFFANFR